MLHSTPPPGFDPRFTIVGACIEVNKKILILRRAAHKPQGETWGLPAGKADAGESLEETAVREIYEETGITLDRQDLGKPRIWYVVLPYVSFVWVVFTVRLVEAPSVTLHDDEHQESGWFTPREALDIGLIDDLDATLVEMYGLNPAT